MNVKNEFAFEFRKSTSIFHKYMLILYYLIIMYSDYQTIELLKESIFLRNMNEYITYCYYIIFVVRNIYNFICINVYFVCIKIFNIDSGFFQI